MKIEIVTFCYREDILLPLFLRHYSWADRITIFFTPDETGVCAYILQSAPNNVFFDEAEFKSGIDDAEKRAILNRYLAGGSEFDWRVVVDMDEFVFLDNRPDRPELLRHQLGFIKDEHFAILVPLRNVYRHESDGELDLSIGPATQRLHGPPADAAENKMYRKPCIIRANLGIQFGVGQHRLEIDPTKTPGSLLETGHDITGSHWQNADPLLAIIRRLRDRRDRMSANNQRCGFGIQHSKTDIWQIMGECLSHKNDPEIF